MDTEELERAARNREIVSQRLYTEAYVQVERALKGYPVTCDLPSWISRDNLVYVNLDELRKLLDMDMIY